MIAMARADIARAKERVRVNVIVRVRLRVTTFNGMSEFVGRMHGALTR